MNAQATAGGTCTKAERDDAYCRITFNGGDARFDRTFEVIGVDRTITNADVADAAAFLALGDPEQWLMDLPRLRASLQVLLLVQAENVEPWLIDDPWLTDDIAQVIERLPDDALESFARGIGETFFEELDSFIVVELGALQLEVSDVDFELRTPIADEASD